MICVSLDTNDSILLKSKDRSFHALFYIIRQMPNEIWYSDGVNKQEICDELNISRAALEKMLSSLTERELLVKISRGKYTLSDELKEDY